MNRHSESGNVLFYILIAVALFAALGFAVNNMMRDGSSSKMNDQTIDLMVTDILDYSRKVRQAIKFMKVSNGCEDSDISFERSPFDGSDPRYVNPNNASDFSCFVFHPDGGSLNEMTPPNGSTSSLSGIDAFSSHITGVYWYDSRRVVRGFGSDTKDAQGNEVLMRLQVTEDICKAINKKMLGSESIPEAGWPYFDFVTDIDNTGAQTELSCGSGDNECDNRQTMCFLQTGGSYDVHQFYSVLIAR